MSLLQIRVNLGAGEASPAPVGVAVPPLLMHFLPELAPGKDALAIIFSITDTKVRPKFRNEFFRLLAIASMCFVFFSFFFCLPSIVPFFASGKTPFLCL